MREDTRKLIVNTASKLFYQKGYNLTGINEVIAEAGIAKATLYSHFKSKEELCIAYLNERDTTLLSELKEYCEKKAIGDAQLIAVLEFLIVFYRSGEFNGCWCIRTIAEIPRENEKIKQTIKDNKKQLLNYIKSLVALNKPSYSLKEQSQLATRIYMLYECAVSESHLQEEVWPIEESIVLLRSLL